jgi:IS30 family transposase
MDAYFCAPQAPWQKGTVENTNGRLRRFLPLDADISDRSTADLRTLAAQMNATPRKCLGFKTPAEAFAASLRSCGVSSAGPAPESRVSGPASISVRDP